MPIMLICIGVVLACIISVVSTLFIKYIRNQSIALGYTLSFLMLAFNAGIVLIAMFVTMAVQCK